MNDLASIRTFPQLVKYLRDELDWPITSDDFEDLTFDYTPQELGIDSKNAAKIQEIKRLRSLSINQPWGVFFVKFEPKRLPIVALRRILSSVALKRRASANSAERKVWEAADLLFISNYGEGDGRQITFAHFSQDPLKQDLPTLKVLGWDNLDTPLHLDHVEDTLRDHLHWPQDETDLQAWRMEWRQAFGLRYSEVVSTSRALAIRLAELARAIRNRISTTLEIETEDGPLTTLMRAFREALVHDLDADGFADMYSQTIAYGLLSARIANPKADTVDDLAAQMPVTYPFLKDLMETFLQAGGRRAEVGNAVNLDFDELGVSEVVELLDHANMEAVLRDFGDRNPEEDPVIHFYELFLKEYDPKEKVKRGVFYTPRPVVSYIVRSVHDLLQTEFGLPDGLADVATWGEMTHRHNGLVIPEGVKPTDRFVTVLDPATGTGTFLVEIIDLVHKTMVAKWKAQSDRGKKIEVLWNEYVAEQLLPRLYGYELLMAPYAIAHLKIGLKLHETGYRFGTDERTRIYLTNSLEPAQDFAARFEFAIPALAHEAMAVNSIKNDVRFTVVLGNPPYAGTSANDSPWATTLLHGRGGDGEKVGNYFEVDGERLGERNPKWLNDDYVKFIRFGHYQICRANTGILAYITNHGYLDNPTFRGMRQALEVAFDVLRFLDLHGSTKKKERTPSDGVDENVFEIMPGVAILLGERTAHRSSTGGECWHADLWGRRDQKYAALLREDVLRTSWEAIHPSSPFYLFVPQDASLAEEFSEGWSLPTMFPVNVLGFQTHRDDFAVAFDREEMVHRITEMRDTRLTNEQLSTRFRLKDNRDWQVSRARDEVRGDTDWKNPLLLCAYRPFDNRWCYFSTVAMDYPRRELTDHVAHRRNLSLLSSRQQATLGYRHCWVTRAPANDCLVSTTSREANQVFPLYLYPGASSGSLLDLHQVGGMPGNRRSNLAADVIAKCEASVGLTWVPDGRGDLKTSFGPEDIFDYTYAILSSPSFRIRYAEFLKTDFPRVPKPGSLTLFSSLVGVGGRLAALHLLESPQLDSLTTTYYGPKNPEVGRVDWSEDTVWLDTAATKKNQTSTPGTIGFRGVPEAVWNFHIGGYQVCEKWLKDRKGRVLTADDITHYQRIVVALHETIRIMSEIDEVIDAHGGWPNAFLVENIVPMPRQAL